MTPGPPGCDVNPAELSPRDGRPEDAPAIAALINTAFAVEEFFAIGDRITAPEIVRLFDTPRSAFLVVDDGDQLVACAYLEPRSPTVGYIGLLAVDPAQQGRGLGGLLMTAAERRLAAAGCELVEISVVDIRTELFPIYERRGYRAGRTAPFPRPSTRPCHLVFMSKPLTKPRAAPE